MSALGIDVKGVLVPCASCGKVNRLPYPTLEKEARCGSCKSKLSAPAAPIEAPSANAFDALIATSSMPVVVDFWAPWCAPCRMVAPELEKVARIASGEFLVVKVNTDGLPDLGERFRIRSIPTMAIFRAGTEVTRTAGARPAEDILALVRDALLQRAS